LVFFYKHFIYFITHLHHSHNLIFSTSVLNVELQKKKKEEEEKCHQIC